MNKFATIARTWMVVLLTTGYFILGASAWAQQGQTSEGSGQSSSQNSSSAPVNRIDQSQLVGLPLNGRSYSSLATLQTGVSETSEGSGARGTSSGGLTVSGGRSTSNTFLMDGSNIMSQDNTVPRSAAGVQLGSDAVQQVQVFSTTYSAEYGRDSGGVLNSITRSGTPQFSGSLFEYLRNSKMDARQFIDVEKPPFKRNQFGFILTGPIKKDKTFFMGSFEAMRDRLTQTESNFVPDAFARQGIIKNCNGDTLRTILVSDRVKPYLSNPDIFYPLPNAGCAGDGVAEVRASHFLPTDENFFVVRVDHQVTQRNSLFSRYTFDQADNRSNEDSFRFTGRVESRQQFLTVADTFIFSLATVNTARFSFTRAVPDNSTIALVDIPIQYFFDPAAPNFGAIIVSGIDSYGPATTNPQHKGQKTFQFTDDLILQRGSHGLKIGAEISRYHWDVSSNRYKGGEWSFNNLDSFLQAGPSNTRLRFALPNSDSAKDYRQTLIGLYIQDDYKLRPGLQFNMGLRYELTTLIHDKNGRDAFLADPMRDAAVQVGSLLEHNPSLKNFSPRLGITWSPGSNDTVLSAGFGIYYDQILEYLVDRQKTQLPFFSLVERPNFISSNLFPDAVAASKLSDIVKAGTRALNYSNISIPTVLRYNFSLQQALPGGVRFQASYVGARGNNLFRTYENNLFPVPVQQPDGSLLFPAYCGQTGLPACSENVRDNRVNPAFGFIEYINSDAQSFYNSLQISANKSLSQGFSLGLSYSLSKSVDDASAVSPDNVQFGWLRTLERARSDFDTRQRLSINYFYTIPTIGKGGSGLQSKLLGSVFGGWRLGGIVSMRTGSPMTAGVSARRTGYLFNANRPNQASGRNNNPIEGTSSGCGTIPAGSALGSSELYFDPCAFLLPKEGTLGQVGRNTMQAANIFTMDLSLQKEFLLDSKRRLQFRSEFFNLPNHLNLGRPSTNVFVGSTGRLSSTAGKIRSQATTPRQIQFALRLSF
ncbi:MAG: hypothetical protein A3F68_10845 [Acidobacteria bacterium RIFCSPLOWO2_12_FULL_54_10]|nr:MAG: hypothetical protein A3F68_10845 [Acidobacteria bacterium RIFCSPLOWO2_12_FULL_54_10]